MRLKIWCPAFVFIICSFFNYLIAAAIYIRPLSIGLSFFSSELRLFILVLLIFGILGFRILPNLLLKLFASSLAIGLILYSAFSYYSFFLTGISAQRNLKMWVSGGQGVLNTLNTLRPNSTTVLLCIVVFAAAIYLIRKTTSRTLREWSLDISVRTILIILIASFALICGEQVVSLNAKEQTSWVIEQDIAPFYIRIIEPNVIVESLKRSYSISLTEMIRRDLVVQNANLTEIRSTPNIFVFVVESLAARFITKTNTPNIAQLRDESLPILKIFANANGTHNAWFSIFMAELPIYYLSARNLPNWQGAVPLQILKKLGYKIEIFDSANIEYQNYRSFLSGGGRVLLESEPIPASLESRWEITDVLAVDRLIKTVDHLPADEKGLFIALPAATHYPYLWPEKNSRKDLLGFNFAKAKISSADRVKIRLQYEAAVNFADHEFGRFVSALKRKGLYDNSIVVLMGDHGEELFENGNLGHGSNLKREQVEIPLYIKFPGTTHYPVSSVASQIDFFPTLFDWMGLDQKNSAKMFAGASLLRTNTSKRFALINKVNGYEANPREFVITDGETKAAFSLNINAKKLESDRLVLQGLTDMNDHQIKDSQTTQQMRSKFKADYQSALEKMIIQKFDLDPN